MTLLEQPQGDYLLLTSGRLSALVLEDAWVNT